MKRVALIPVYCSGIQRSSKLTLAWYELLAKQIERYFDTQSGGRAGLTCRAFDWRQIPLTAQQWAQAGVLAGRQVVDWMASRGDIVKADFDVFVVLIEDGVSYGGIAPNEAPEIVHVAAVGTADDPFGAALVLHELGHRLEATHTYLQTPGGVSEYDGPFCVMGREVGKHVYLEPQLVVPAQGASEGDAVFGPGMCFINLVRCGWMNPRRYGVWLTSGSISGGVQTVEISALNGTPPDTVERAKVACIIDFGRATDRLVIEYRSPNVAFDAGVPASAAAAPTKGGAAKVVANGGQLVVYRTASLDDPTPLQVNAVDAVPGQILSFTTPLAQALGQALGPVAQATLKLVVLRVTSLSVRFRIEWQLGAAPQFERTAQLKDFLQWQVAGHDAGGDPVQVALKALAEAQDLARLRELVGPRDKPALSEAMQGRLEALNAIAQKLRL